MGTGPPRVHEDSALYGIYGFLQHAVQPRPVADGDVDLSEGLGDRRDHGADGRVATLRQVVVDQYSPPEDAPRSWSSAAQRSPRSISARSGRQPLLGTRKKSGWLQSE